MSPVDTNVKQTWEWKEEEDNVTRRRRKMPPSSAVDSLGHGERQDNGDRTQRVRRYIKAKDKGSWGSERGEGNGDRGHTTCSKRWED